jgi:hypothetical protein
MSKKIFPKKYFKLKIKILKENKDIEYCSESKLFETIINILEFI